MVVSAGTIKSVLWHVCVRRSITASTVRVQAMRHMLSTCNPRSTCCTKQSGGGIAIANELTASRIMSPRVVHNSLCVKSSCTTTLVDVDGGVECIAEGDFVQETRTYTADDVRQFADLTGDHNGIHVDDAYAKKSRFGRCIVHGMLLNGALSSLIANKLPGPGSVYIKQEITFRAPVFVGDAFIARVEVLRVKGSRRVAHVSTTCLDPVEGTVLVEGVATILLPPHTKIVTHKD